MFTCVWQGARKKFKACLVLSLSTSLLLQYFSTLERLRFAHQEFIDSGRSSVAIDLNNNNLEEKGSQNLNCGRKAAWRAPGIIINSSRFESDSLAEHTGRPTSLHELGSSPPGSNIVDQATWFAGLPEKVKKRYFSLDERVAFIRAGAAISRHQQQPRRESVILDAADETILRKLIARRATSGGTTPPHSTGPAHTPASRVRPRDRMKPTDSERRALQPEAGRPSLSWMPDEFLDSFRWLDEGDNLDLRLCLDDHHASTRDSVSESNERSRGPTFTRHSPVNKVPIGRSSVSSTIPATKDSHPSPTLPISPSFNNISNMKALPGSPSRSSSPSLSSSPAMCTSHHGVLPGIHTSGRSRRTRNLSLISNNQKGGGGDSGCGSSTHVTSPVAAEPFIDPEAAHYQDPEARLKLRVYLASPQKFDEAIEFGFPSRDVIGARPAREIRNQKPRGNSRASGSFAASASILGDPAVASASIPTPTTSASAARGRNRRENDFCAGWSDGMMRSFLADGNDEDEDDEYEDGFRDSGSDSPSIADPESPLTPSTWEKPSPSTTIKPMRLPGHVLTPTLEVGTMMTTTTLSSLSSSSSYYAQAPTDGREMTLRMTLTRPDLRSHEEHIYGWGNVGGKKTSTVRAEPWNAVTHLDCEEKGNVGLDFTRRAEFVGAGGGSLERRGHGGVVRRFWDKVRHH